MRGRRVAVSALLWGLAPLLAGIGCADEDALRAAEARRDSLLRSTAPKAELWRELERKGTALQEARKLEASEAAGSGRALAARAEVEAALVELAELVRRRTEREAELAQAREQLALARLEKERRVQLLREFEVRRREAGPRS